MRFGKATAYFTLSLGVALGACGGSDSTPSNGGSTDGGTTDGGGGSSSGGSSGSSSGGSSGSSSGGSSGSSSGGSSGSSSGGPGNTPIKTVFVIVMENHNWSSIKGSSSAPYINGLLKSAAHAENYFDNPKAVHPSEPNYLWMESGDNLGITNDLDPSTNHQSTTDHLVTQLTAKGVTWRAYQEDMKVGTCPIVSNGLYAPKHCPMVFFDDVSGNPPSTSSANCIAHVVPYTQLATDLTANTVAQYNFITPNLCNDMHNSSGCATSDAVANGDTWLSNEVPKILNSAAYKNNGALFITWDESEGGEYPIGMIVLSPKAKVGYATQASAPKYYHSSFLRTVQEIFGVTPLLRDAANQPDLSDLFMSFP